MEQSSLQVFAFEGQSNTRVVTDENGELWVVARDVASALGYSEASMTNMKRLLSAIPDEWKGRKRITTLGGEQEMLCLSEQGMYFFLGRSDKPLALPYQKWIAGEVIPSIRKTGAYMTPVTLEKAISDPDFMIGILTALKEEQLKSKQLAEENTELRAQQELDAPKVQFAEAVADSESGILVGELSKLLHKNGVKGAGQNRLFTWLRENGYLIKRPGSSWNLPTQRTLDDGLMMVAESVIELKDGSTRPVLTTRVTGKGQQYFLDLFLGGKANLDKVQNSALARQQRVRDAYRQCRRAEEEE